MFFFSVFLFGWEATPQRRLPVFFCVFSMTLKHFKLSEFDDPTVEGSGKLMNAEFLDKLDALRDECAFPFRISSGYRTKERNSAVGGKALSAHLLGRACDIVVANGEEIYMLVKLAPKYGFTGIGVKNINGSRMVHLDDIGATEYPLIPRPAMWSY